MSCLSVISLIAGVIVLGQAAPAGRVEGTQHIYPFDIHNQLVHGRQAAEESLDINSISKDFLSSILGSKCPGDGFRRLGAFLTSIDKIEGEYGGKELGQMFENFADFIQQYFEQENDTDCNSKVYS